MKVSRSELNVFLDDLVWEKFGIRWYYTVNAYAVGQVVCGTRDSHRIFGERYYFLFQVLALILTVAIVRIQNGQG